MFLTSFVLSITSITLCQAPPKQSDAATPEMPKAFGQLETMRKMLQKKLDEKRGELLGVENPADADGDGFPETPGLYGSASDKGPVTGDFYRHVYSASSVAQSEADYVPGLAAIFHLKVNLRSEPVPAAKKDESETPTQEDEKKKKSGDDEAWDSLARGDANVDAWRRARLGAVAGEGFTVLRPAQQRLNPRAVETLRSTIVDTIWRFGHKLELERGERIAVVVEARAASGSFTFRSSGRADNIPGEPAANVSADGRRPGGADDYVNDDLASLGYMLGVAGGGSSMQYQPSLHFVIQVSAEDLKAFRSGELDQDDLGKRTKTQTFVGPSSQVTSWPSMNAAR